MNIIKRYTIILAVAVSPMFLFAQDSPLKYEHLPTEKDKEAKNLEDYNKGAEHYNKAISIMKEAGTEFANLEELNSLQIKSLEEFKLALPYFEKAHKLDPKHENTLLGLTGAYFALNETEKSKGYQKEYNEVHKSN